MIKHKFSIFVIENSLKLLIKINENYYKNSIKNNNFHFVKNDKTIYNDGSDSEKNENVNIIDNREKIFYQNFCKLKEKIFQIVENNPFAKEKKNIIVLLKKFANKYL